MATNNMFLFCDCCGIGLVQVMVCFGFITDTNPSEAGIPELLILQCDYPIWNRDYYDRLMPIVTSAKTVQTEEFCSNIHFTDMNSTPWNQIYQNVECIDLNGLNGFDNQLVVNDIEYGYLGRTFKNIGYLGITGLSFKNITKQMFAGLNRLKVLFLYVSIDFIHVDTFTTVPQLIWLRFENSMIENISPAYFCNNNQLTFLQLRHNRLQYLNGSLPHNCSRSTINSLLFGGNNFSTLTAGMFQNYTVNGVLQISNCSITKINSDTFIGLENLLDVDLSDNRIASIPNGTFSRMNTSIQGIQMSNNLLSVIDIDGLFGGLETLISLDFSSNQITSVLGTFLILPNLLEIYLENNKLDILNESLFNNLTRLRMLAISNNSLKSIDKNSFTDLEALRDLDLSYNRLRCIDPSQFANLNKVKRMNISNNQIMFLHKNVFEHNAALEHLDVSHNNLTNVDVLILNAPNLTSINISDNNLMHFPTILSQEQLPGIDDYFSKLVLINASSNQIVTLLDLSENRLTQMPLLHKLPMLHELWLRNNRIKHIDVDFVKLRSLTILDLGNNIIESVSPNIFPDSLQVLYLDHNKLKTLDIVQLKYLKTLALSDNPLKCSCENEELFNWIRTQYSTSIDNVTCTTPSAEIKAAVSFDLDQCDLVERLKIIIPIASVGVLMLLVLLIVFKFRYEIQVIAFYKWHIRLDLTCKRKKCDTSYTYDAFVCFAEDDIPFVEETLKPMLEPKYTLCLYYRDFHVGDDIAEAILKGIKESGMTIIVLSVSFLKSRWGRFEFRHAHHHVMFSRNQKLAIIILDETVLSQKLDLTLRSILYTKKYLKCWDYLFKEKLLHLVHSVSERPEPREDEALLSS